MIATFETEEAADRAMDAIGNPMTAEDEPSAVTSIDVEDATFATLALLVPRRPDDPGSADVVWEEAVVDLGGPTEAEDPTGLNDDPPTEGGL